MEVMEGVAGPNVLASNNFFFSFSDQKYLTGPSDLAKQLLLINRDERPLYCNNPGSWFKAQQILLSYLQIQTETWTYKQWIWIFKRTQQT